MISFRELRRLIYMVTIDRKNWEYNSNGYCNSCGRQAFFFYSKLLNKTLSEFIKEWELSEIFKFNLLERENYFCCYCYSNFRKRVHAGTVYRLFEIDGLSDFYRLVRGGADVYETAKYNVFTGNKLKKYPHYVVSEYFYGVQWGSMVEGVRNENLESLTFPDNSFDLLINSDVLSM